MDIKWLIINKIKQKGGVSAPDIVKVAGFSRAYVNRFFQELRDEGKIVLIGKARQARYVLATKEAVEKEKKRILKFHARLINKGLIEDQVLDNIKKNTGIFIGLPENVALIVEYAFTEMLNNAIEHSKSKLINVSIGRDNDTIDFAVADKGIGIFKNLMKNKKLGSEIVAIQELLKGKQTTDPARHSGEGIFFTSKAGDSLVIESGHKKLRFNNILEDVFVEDSKPTKGTVVKFSIGFRSKRDLGEIFRAYSDEALKFTKTKVVIRLFQLGEEFISRSEARRVVTGLEDFNEIVFDFKDVKSVGQAFADEIFRVWKIHNPVKKIEYINANENVGFMIERASL